MSIEQARKVGKADKAPSESIAVFVALACSAGFAVDIDAPASSGAEYFLDIEKDAFSETVSWQEARGYGFYTGERGYGDKPSELYLDASSAFERLGQIHQRSGSERISSSLSLAELRQLRHVSQSDVADLADIKQSAVSRFESRGDVRLSTLVAYLAALGGRLELRVHFDRMDVAIDLPGTAAST